MGTGRREFTEEEQAILKQNPYTYRVFKNSIRFTIEFMGYDAEMLGKRCVNSLYRNLQKQQASPAELHEGSVRSKKIRPGSTDYDAVTPKRAMQLMQHELLYLRQEVEFLKKIINADKPPKKGGQ